MFVLATEDICPVSAADICPVSTADICPVSTEDIYPVSTEDISPVSTEDGACPDTVGIGCTQKNLPPWKRGVSVTKPERSYLANPHIKGSRHTHSQIGRQLPEAYQTE